MDTVEIPHFFGINHSDQTKMSEAIQTIETFGAKGRTFFVEGHERSLVSGNPNTVPFFAALQKAKEIGMKIVFLDRAITHYRHYVLSKNEQYLHFIRERSWMKKIAKQAKPDDIVMMHPDHLLSIQRTHFWFSGLESKIHYISKPSGIDTWQLDQINRFREIRNAKRPIHQRKRTPRI